MNKYLFTLFASFSLLLAYCNSKEKVPTEASPTTTPPPDSLATELSIDLTDFTDNQTLPKTQEVAIAYDPFFKQAKKFIGFSLQNLLDSIIKVHQFDTTEAVVVFECADGYRPTMPISLVFGDKKGFIAIRDLDAAAGENWIDSLDKKMKPFYLVWQDVPKENHRYAFPYGLYALRLVPAGSEFKDVYPFDAPEVVAGFQLFNQNCMKCHSVNKVGGVMGPEMNIPKNITEYWTDENIIAFAKNPQSFRYRSAMAPIAGVSDQEFKQILDYLKYIAKHKVEL
jgi:mono/diheme cytochrome c family protein